MRSLLASAVVLSALGAFNFGLNTVNFNASKEFAIVDFGWCEGEPENYDCARSRMYGSFSNGATLIGAAIGCVLMAYLCELGRRRPMMIMHAINIVGCIISASSQGFVMLFFGRLISGISVGLCAIVPMLIAEVCPSASRGIYGTIYPLFITFGQVSITSFQLLHGRIAENTDVSEFEITLMDKVIWRSAQAIPMIFSLISLFVLFFIFKDDTPHVLIRDGKMDLARKVVSELHGEENVDEIIAEISKSQESAKVSPNIGFFAAVRMRHGRRPILTCILLSALQQISGINVFMMNATKLFVAIMGRSFVSSVVGSVGVLLNFLVTSTLFFYVDKLGRRTMLLIGISISSLFMVPPIFFRLFVKNKYWASIVSAIGCLGFVVGFAIGLGGVMWLYFTEALDSEYKDSVFSVCTLVNWVSAAVVVTSSDFLLAYSEQLVHMLFTSFCLVTLAFVYFFVKDTKDVPMGKAYF